MDKGEGVLIVMKVLALLFAVNIVCSLSGMTVRAASFPSTDSSVRIGTNTLHFSCSSPNSDDMFTLKIELRSDSDILDKKILGAMFHGVVIGNSIIDTGFLLECQLGPNKNDVGCYNVYSVTEVNGKLVLRPFTELIKDNDFGVEGGIAGVPWGAKYIAERCKDMSVAVKVGYGIGTNQLFTVGLKDCSGRLTRIHKEYEHLLIGEPSPHEINLKSAACKPVE